MPTIIYDVTATAKCWRLHDCVECGCAYRYLCQSHVTGSGESVEVATERANRAAIEALAEIVEVRPCPQCGLVQPYAIATKKYRLHLVATGLAVALAGTGVGIAVTGNGARADAAAGMLLIGSILAVVCHLVIALLNPNWSRSRNLRNAQKELSSGRMQLVRQGESHDHDPRTRMFGLGHVFYLLLAAGAVAATLVPSVIALQKGWHRNKDLNPTIITPGDVVRVTFPETPEAALGQWAGWPTITIENETELGGTFKIKAHSQRDAWDTITGMGIKNEPVNLWAEIELPADAALNGRTLTLNIYMPVLFCRSGVGGRFTNEIVKVYKTVELHLSPIGARAEERQYRLLGAWGSAILIFVSGLGLVGLSWSLRRRCAPGLMQPFSDASNAEARGVGPSKATMFGSERVEPAEAPAQPDTAKPWHRW
jgi:hypothetical protein